MRKSAIASPIRRRSLRFALLSVSIGCSSECHARTGADKKAFFCVGGGGGRQKWGREKKFLWGAFFFFFFHLLGVFLMRQRQLRIAVLVFFFALLALPLCIAYGGSIKTLPPPSKVLCGPRACDNVRALKAEMFSSDSSGRCQSGFFPQTSWIQP